MRTLYVFPISHYCEKSRWNLDAKGLAHRVVNVFPGTHRLLTWRLSRSRTLPILVDGDRVIPDSTDIAVYLDESYSAGPLLPREASQRERVLELEDTFDRAGVHVRRWMYGQLLHAPGALDVWLRPYAAPLRWLGAAAAPLLRATLRKLYRLEPGAITRSHERVRETLDTLDGLVTAARGEYLAGDTLSIADITAATMLGPLLMPAGSPWEPLGELSESIARLRAESLERPSGKWVLARWARDRSVTPGAGPSTSVSR